MNADFICNAIPTKNIYILYSWALTSWAPIETATAAKKESEKSAYIYSIDVPCAVVSMCEENKNAHTFFGVIDGS